MKVVLLSIFIAIALHSYAQSADDLVKEASRLENTLRDGDALIKYKEALKVQPTNIFALCRSSELCSRIANRIKNNKKTGMTITLLPKLMRKRHWLLTQNLLMQISLCLLLWGDLH